MDRARVKKVFKTVGIWIPAILLSLIFIPAGLDKFSDTRGWARAFRHWGYPDSFRILIGVLELGAVPLLLSGRFAAWGAIIIIAVMLGAMGTHIAYDGGRHLTSEIVPLTLATIVLVVRRAQFRGAERRATGAND